MEQFSRQEAHAQQELRTFVDGLLDQTDEMIRQGFAAGERGRVKEGIQASTSIVTETDEKVEAFLRQKLQERYPTIGFVGEESASQVAELSNWVIDPIDGTLNYSKGIPVCGTSLALWEENRPVIGMVSFPMLNFRVTAQEGKGLLVNGEPVSPLQEQSTAPYILYSVVAHNERKTELVKAISERIIVPRDFGSAVYNILLVALGKADAAIIWDLSVWDIGVAPLFMQEQGLETRFLSASVDLQIPAKSDTDSYKHKLVIGRPELVEKLATTLEQFNGEVA